MDAPPALELVLPWWWGMAVGALLLFLYFSNERSALHRGSVERLFWPLVYAWFASLWVLRPSRAASQHVHEYFGSVTRTDAAVVAMAAFLGHIVYSHNQRQRMASRISQAALSQMARKLALKRPIETVPARIATARLRHILGTQGAPPGFFGGLLWESWGAMTGRRLRVQGAVLAVLQECCQASHEDLLYVLSQGDLDLPQLFATAGTRGVMALVTDVAPHMDVVTKAVLIDALHRQVDFVHMLHLQRPVAAMILGTRGHELTTLKNLIDELGGFYNLHKLMFFDFSADLSLSVLRHIETEGHLLRASIPVDGVRQLDMPRKILSDIDDTFFSSGGHFPAGVDRRYAKHQIYPGVLSLFRELDRCWYSNQGIESREQALQESQECAEVPLWIRVSPHEWLDLTVPSSETIAGLKERLASVRSSQAPPWPGSVGALGERGVEEMSFAPPTCRPTSNLAFLSARPHAYKDYMESRLYSLFWGLHARGMLHCMPTLLAGRLGSSLRSAAVGAVLQFRGRVVLVLAFISLLAITAHRHCLPCILVLCVFLGISVAARRRRKVVWKPVSFDKVRTFRQYQRLYSEFSMVFFGDNGQGDLLCAEELAAPTESQHCGKLEAPAAVFIHEVVPLGSQLSSLADHMGHEEGAATWSRLHIYFHRTYVGAAVNAYHCGLLSLEGLARVGRSAVEDLVRMRIDQLRDVRRAWVERVAELNADIDRANALLPQHLLVERVPEAAGTLGAIQRRGANVTPVNASLVASAEFAGLPGTGLESFAFRTLPPGPWR